MVPGCVMIPHYIFRPRRPGTSGRHAAMPWNVGDRVINRRGWTGTVVAVDEVNAYVEFDNGEPSSPFGRDEDVILEPI